MSKYTASQIANYFIKYSLESEVDLSKLTPLKLQKLLYYAQGWYLGNTGEPLFDDEIAAWQYGPVVVKVYELFKHYNRGKIDKLVPDIDISELLEDEKIVDYLKKLIRIIIRK